MVQITINNDTSVILSINELDTDQMIVDKIAAILNTTAGFLFFPIGRVPTGKEFRSTQNVDVVDILDIITSPDAGTSFTRLMNTIHPMLSQQRLDINGAVLVPFIAYNNAIQDLDPAERDMVLFSIAQEIQAFGINVDLQAVWNDRDNIKSQISALISEVQERVNTSLQTNLMETVQDTEHTAFELEKTKFVFRLDIDNMNLIGLFNLIELNPNVPFMNYKDLYKIMNDFRIPTGWTESDTTESIMLKVSKHPLLPGVTTDEDYLTVFISNELSVSVFMEDKDSMTAADIATRISETIQHSGDVVPVDIRESKVNGQFTFPSHAFNQFVFADMVMNDTIFSSVMTIDERRRATKRSDALYAMFEDEGIGQVRITITEKVGDTPDSVYTRVKVVSADNVASATKFQAVFSKLMTVYNNKYEEIVSAYREFIPDFAVTKERVVKISSKKNRLKDIAPEVFAIGYPPLCSKQPTILTDAEAEEAKRKGLQVMVFPKPGLAIKQRNYVCDYSAAKYPGLRTNPLANKDVLPFLPCCYGKNQRDTERSKYRQYFYDEESAAETAKQQNIIITNKFLNENAYGSIPEGVERLLKSFSDDQKIVFRRKGVGGGQKSLLQCVLHALKSDKDLTAELERIGKSDHIFVGRQEMYESNVADISESLVPSEKYLDPQLFVSILESFYGCNIFVFNRDAMSLPRNLESFYKNKISGPSIIVYEHRGGTADRSDNPRCELIIARKETGRKTSGERLIFEMEESVSTGLQDVFESVQDSFALTKRVPDIIFPRDVEGVVDQTIDAKGKCRSVSLIHKKKTITVLTSPVQPLPVQERSSSTRLGPTTTLEVAQQFIQDEGLRILTQYADNGLLKELICEWGVLVVSIPILGSSDPLPDIAFSNFHMVCSETGTSELDKYAIHSRRAHILTEYTRWLFAHFVDAHDSGVLFETFANERIHIQPNFPYAHVPQAFSMTSGVMANGKLVVESEETLKRLIFQLRVFAIRHTATLRTYHTQTYIPNYYNELSDFEQYPSQTLIRGDDTLMDWNDDDVRTLVDTIKIDATTPYFFKNKLVEDGHILLIHPANTLQNAIETAIRWENGRVETTKIKYNLYSYTDYETIKRHVIRGEQTTYNVNVMGYKKDDKPYFISLLRV